MRSAGVGPWFNRARFLNVYIKLFCKPFKFPLLDAIHLIARGSKSNNEKEIVGDEMGYFHLRHSLIPAVQLGLKKSSGRRSLQ